jgi:thymidylate synthase (FAD)
MELKTIENVDKITHFEDGIGYLKLIDHCGSDLSIVNAARISYAGNEDVKEIKTHEKTLILKMATNGHWTPFAHPHITIRIKMPIFVARQWMRHTIGIVTNEMSRRYVSDKVIPEFYIVNNHCDTLEFTKKQTEHNEQSYKLYKNMLENGFSPEHARVVLPVSLYTELTQTMSLMSAARIYKQRSSKHAQIEIQHYAKMLDLVVRPLYPEAWSALVSF